MKALLWAVGDCETAQSILLSPLAKMLFMLMVVFSTLYSEAFVDPACFDVIIARCCI